MEAHLSLTDSDFEKQFADCTLSPEVFTHEAHLRLAYIHINRYGPEQACKNVSEQLMAYVKKLGVEDKFNMTLTIASMKIVNHFMGKSGSNCYIDFIEEFPQLKSEFKRLVETHYSFDIFSNETAKKHYTEPDLMLF